MASKRLVKNALTLGGFGVSLGVLGWAIRAAIHSPLFEVTEVKVAHSPASLFAWRPPLSNDAVIRLSGIGLASDTSLSSPSNPNIKKSLFGISLSAIEKNIVQSDWIAGADVKKSYPHGIAITVSYREPVAVIFLQKASKRQLAYVDAQGKVFGHVNLLTHVDLPILQGMSSDNSEQIILALKIISTWKGAFAQTADLSTIQWDSERGFRVWINYGNPANSGRTVVELGRDVPNARSLQQLSRVLAYLNTNGIQVSRIFAELGKKVVVKTRYGS